MRDDIAAINADFEYASAETILEWAFKTYGSKLAISCSFGGPSGMAILDMALKIDRSAVIYYLDTDLLFAETSQLVDIIRQRYGIEPIRVRPSTTLEQQEMTSGAELWKHHPDRCCEIRKVEPQRRFLRDYSAWVTGIRRDQAPTRAATAVLNWDETFEVVKVSPLARWTEPDVWRYIDEHDVPRNTLHALGFASIGCMPCTRPISDGEQLRSGRWSGSTKIECGLHPRIDSARTRV